MTELSKTLEGHERLARHEDKVDEALAKRIEKSDEQAANVRRAEPREGDLGDVGRGVISSAPREVLGGASTPMARAIPSGEDFEDLRAVS